MRLLRAVANGSATGFPPPLWGRDSERGTPKAPSSSGDTLLPSTMHSEKPFPTTSAEQVAYPPPHPSPTRGREPAEFTAAVSAFN